MRPQVTVLGPNPLLSVAIETRAGRDDVHLHAAGQGVWAARMAAELGADPILCAFLGGETGVALRPILEALPLELRIAPTAGASGSYVVDRRGMKRQVLAHALGSPPSRHETDDLVAEACVASLASEALAVCNPFPAHGFPQEGFDTIIADARSGGTPVLVDMSSPRLDSVLEHEPDLVKLNDWELAEYVCGPVDGPRALSAARRVREAGAQAVVVTRAEEPILVLEGDREPFEVVPPPFPRGFREGCGDAMFGAIAAAWARGMSLEDALVLGAAAGAANFLRHGLGSAKLSAVEQLVPKVQVRSLTRAAA